MERGGVFEPRVPKCLLGGGDVLAVGFRQVGEVVAACVTRLSGADGREVWSVTLHDASDGAHSAVESIAALADGGVATLRGESQGQGGELQLASLQVSAAGQSIDVPVGGRGGDGGGGGSAEVIDVDSR